MQRFTITPPGGDAVVLGDDAIGIPIVIDQRDHTRLVGEVNMWDAESSQTQALGNRRNSIGFGASYTLESDEEMNAWLADFPDSIPGQGVLAWTTGNTERCLSDATLKEFKLARLDGKTAFVHYLFTGGAFSKPATDAV